MDEETKRVNEHGTVQQDKNGVDRATYEMLHDAQQSLMHAALALRQKGKEQLRLRPS